MTGPGESKRPRGSLTRRRLFIGAAGLAAGGAGIGVAEALRSGAQAADVPRVALPTLAAGLPARQHAWTATLGRDADGNPVAPRYDRLLFFDVRGRPTPAYARLLEASLRTLEHRYRWGPRGLLFTAAWGPGYFEDILRTSSPVPRATGLSNFEVPSIDDYHLCLHLAGDDERQLADVEAALVHGAPLGGAVGPVAVDSILRWRETRTGFVGAGLPARHQDVGGIPPGRPVSDSAPLFMGFRSNLRRNQATEDAVTVPDGPLAGGTTMAVSYMRLRLDSWYDDLSQRERIARMYAPQVTPDDLAGFTTDAASDPALLSQAIKRYAVIGHAQTSARARRHGKPRVIRRDFNTVDGGQAGLHFVSLQRSIPDFVATRNAMNASTAQLENPAITDTVNNGINEFIIVLKRANYAVPARADRSFPLLAGRTRGLRS